MKLALFTTLIASASAFAPMAVQRPSAALRASEFSDRKSISFSPAMVLAPMMTHTHI